MTVTLDFCSGSLFIMSSIVMLLAAWGYGSRHGMETGYRMGFRAGHKIGMDQQLNLESKGRLSSIFPVQEE